MQKDRQIIDFDKVENQEVAAELLLEQKIKIDEQLRGASIVRGDDGQIFAQQNNKKILLGHISEGLILLENQLNRNL